MCVNIVHVRHRFSMDWWLCDRSVCLCRIVIYICLYGISAVAPLPRNNLRGVPHPSSIQVMLGSDDRFVIELPAGRCCARASVCMCLQFRSYRGRRKQNNNNNNNNTNIHYTVFDTCFVRNVTQHELYIICCCCCFLSPLIIRGSWYFQLLLLNETVKTDYEHRAGILVLDLVVNTCNERARIDCRCVKKNKRSEAYWIMWVWNLCGHWEAKCDFLFLLALNWCSFCWFGWICWLHQNENHADLQ